MIEITVPKLGLTMEKADLIKWEVGLGDRVTEGEILFVIETDKVTFEVPSPSEGLLFPLVAAGTRCEVEETVAYLAADQAEYETLLKEYPGVAREVKREEKAAGAGGMSPGSVKTAAITSEKPGTQRIKASPLARAMAEKNELSLSAIPGSGPGGRIVKADILKALKKSGSEQSGAEPAGTELLKQPAESIPIRGVRKVIFDNMYQSLQQSAQLTLHTEADAKALVSLRELLKKRGESPSYNALLVKIAASALRAHPAVNASVEENAITVWRQIHIGVAMETAGALVVPVVRNPDRKAIGQVEDDLRALIAKAKEKRLSPDDLMNGTFTLSNLGFADVDFFTPIIRPPESAILGIGRIMKKAVIENGQVVPGLRISLSLTFDHRIIDGAPAARFLKTIKDTVENPLLLIS